MVGSNETPVDDKAIAEIEGNEAVQEAVRDALVQENLVKSGLGTSDQEMKKIDQIMREGSRKGSNLRGL